MHGVVPLLLEHLLETAAQNLDVAAGQCFDHECEAAVQYGVRGHEFRPVAPGSIEVRNIRVASGLVRDVRRAQLAQRPVEHTAVPDVVEPHGGCRDIGLQRGRGDAPLRIAHPKQLFVVGQTLDQRVEAQASASPGAQSWMMAAFGTIIISTQRSSS